ncbi:hypothetical protein GCM10018785_43530 [Streptomyces longispororuber]|uniref:SSD domain-containing protein n=1 Tax=Streptomyces longispororuber TaxID=68230 RepID=A0A918ZVK8_9ACTN|nr:MMPL family transporter [Streptomyces longispororuber]GHE70323.1 hypothetical protein GCM10018785_43530 [Streptomyces longispororuber]
MATFLYRLGRAALRWRRRVVLLWVAVLAVAGVGALSASDPPDDSSSMPGIEAQEAFDLINERFPGAEAEAASARIVFVAPHGERVTATAHREAIGTLVSDVADGPQVADATDPFDGRGVSEDGTTAYTTVTYEVKDDDVSAAAKRDLEDAVERARGSGLTVETGGSVLESQAAAGTGEVVGVLVAALVLLVTFGSLAAAGLSLLSALVGVGVSLTAVIALGSVLGLSSTTGELAMMIGVAVGIDYALFVVNRYRQERAAGHGPREATGLAVGTAGSAVVFAGLTVVIALAGLSVVGVPLLTKMGLAAAGAVLTAVLVALTLTPALLGFWPDAVLARRVRYPGRGRGLGRGRGHGGRGGGRGRSRGNGRRERRALRRGVRRPGLRGGAGEGGKAGSAARGAGAPGEGRAGAPAEGRAGGAAEGRSGAPAEFRVSNDRPAEGSSAGPSPRGEGAEGASSRWVRFVLRRPRPVLLLTVAGLGALAVPVTDLRLGMPGDEAKSTTTTERRAYDALADGFGPGFNGPLTIAVDLRGAADPEAATEAVAARIAATDGVVSVSPARFDAARHTAVLTATPATAPTSERTEELVRAIRDERPATASATGASFEVTGVTALNIDVARKMRGALVPYLSVIVGLAFVLLMVVFRSVLVPLKAALGYLLSVLAALGALVTVFQHGHGAGLLGVEQTGPVMSLMPIFLVGIVFGLAMDYQVFLVSRMREAYLRGERPRQAVVTGFRHSALVVAAAALIMTAVFSGFMTAGDSMMTMVGFGLATAVLLDAFVVRMAFVPAVLALLGERAWWLPRFLARSLPRVDVEGEALFHRTATVPSPAGPTAGDQARDQARDQAGDDTGGDPRTDTGTADTNANSTGLRRR